MSHKSKCFRSDGDWFCESNCTHDKDEIANRSEQELVKLQQQLSLIQREKNEIQAAFDYQCAALESAVNSENALRAKLTTVFESLEQMTAIARALMKERTR